ncbi:MAG TPA: hypothetical protein DDW89_09870 [Gammaproteobacteria bacterium]|nr:hypothetical protein [Gammaproteobacteria bacterium]
MLMQILDDMIAGIIDRLRGHGRRRIYESSSAWYACTGDTTETWEVGPCQSAQEAEAEIRQMYDPAEPRKPTVALCTIDSVRVSDYVDEALVDWLSDWIWDDNRPADEPVMRLTDHQRTDLIRGLKYAVDAWQERHQIVVAGCRFSRVEQAREVEI